MAEYKGNPVSFNAHGQAVDILNPQPEEIHLSDIALGISKECRYTGQFEGFYSVAQHSVLTSLYVPQDQARMALLHDTAEWMTGDIPSPIKRLLGPRIREIEARLTLAVFKKFEIEPFSAEDPISPEVHDADYYVHVQEVHDLLHPGWKDWHVLEERESTDAFPIIYPMEWQEAYEYFLDRFATLWAVDYLSLRLS